MHLYAISGIAVFIDMCCIVSGSEFCRHREQTRRRVELVHGPRPHQGGQLQRARAGRPAGLLRGSGQPPPVHLTADPAAAFRVVAAVAESSTGECSLVPILPLPLSFHSIPFRPCADSTHRHLHLPCRSSAQTSWTTVCGSRGTKTTTCSCTRGARPSSRALPGRRWAPREAKQAPRGTRPAVCLFACLLGPSSVCFDIFFSFSAVNKIVNRYHSQSPALPCP